MIVGGETRRLWVVMVVCYMLQDDIKSDFKYYFGIICYEMYNPFIGGIVTQTTSNDHKILLSNQIVKFYKISK